MMRRFGIKSRKRLGQHFLVDEAVLRRIIAAAEITPADTILEIGPGPGILTGEMAKRAGRVIAVELDNRLAAALKETMAGANNVTIINDDILRLDPTTLLTGQTSYKVVANLPYYITSPVLRHLLEATFRPEKMVLMVQREVAEAIAAVPGRRSLLSISVQYYGEPRIVDTVPAEAFYPAPEVDSALLNIEVYRQPAVRVSDEKGFFKLVRAGFTASRKQIANSLAQGLGMDKKTTLVMLAEAGIQPQRRAETLTLEEWAGLWRVFSGTREGKTAC